MLKRSSFKKKTVAEIAEMREKKRQKLPLLKSEGKVAAKSQILTNKRVVARPVKKKSELMPARVKKAKRLLEEISHTYVRVRDSIDDDKIAGCCVDCGKYAEYAQFQCGHFLPSGSSGAVLRYHPRNMHGQAGGCNVGYQQERVKIDYTVAMIKKYGIDYVNKLRLMKNISIKADINFYEDMIELYKKGDEQAICDYLESHL